MKRIYTFLLVVLVNQYFLHAQEKHDYIWVMGTKIVNSAHRNGGDLIDFNSGMADTTSLNIQFYLDQTMGTISDRYGNLQFYTNGCDVMTKNHQLMSNGDSLNVPFSGPWQEDNCARDLSYGPHSGLIILPVPGTNDR